MSKQFREQELKDELNSFDQVYVVDDDIEDLTGAEYRERCRDRWIVNRREIVMHSLIICQTALIGLGDAMEALGHTVDSPAELAMALDRLIEEYKRL
tara:strand:- start:152 stop:442 length:291 start_codon:yes stop_codon:yes gene_type:complete